MKDNTLTVKGITIDEAKITLENLQSFLDSLQQELTDITGGIKCNTNNKLSNKDYNKYIQIKQIIVLLRFVEIQLIKQEDKKNLLTELRQNAIYNEVLKYEKIIEDYNSSKQYSLESILENKYTVPNLDDINDAEALDKEQKKLTEALQKIKFTEKDQLRKFFYSVISADPITIAMMLDTNREFNKDFGKFYHSEPFKIITKTILIAAAGACISCVLIPWLSGIAVTSTVAIILIKTCINIAIASPGAVVPSLVGKMFERNIKLSDENEKQIMDKLNAINLNNELSENILKEATSNKIGNFNENAFSKRFINTICNVNDNESVNNLIQSQKAAKPVVQPKAAEPAQPAQTLPNGNNALINQLQEEKQG